MLQRGGRQLQCKRRVERDGASLPGFGATVPAELRSIGAVAATVDDAVTTLVDFGFDVHS